MVFSLISSQNFKRKFCEQTEDPDQKLQNAVSYPDLYCLPMSHKKGARLKWINNINTYRKTEAHIIAHACALQFTSGTAVNNLNNTMSSLLKARPAIGNKSFQQ